MKEWVDRYWLVDLLVGCTRHIFGVQANERFYSSKVRSNQMMRCEVRVCLSLYMCMHACQSLSLTNFAANGVAGPFAVEPPLLSALVPVLTVKEVCRSLRNFFIARSP